MFPKRQLLYHRGLDDSIGTYVTDYVLTAECLILAFILYYLRFVKCNKQLSRTGGHTRSTWTTIVLLLGVGIGAFIGGLAHQYVNQVEPYSGPRDAIHWVILWRLAAAFSGVVSFALFLLAEFLVTSEELLCPPRHFYNAYYAFAGLFSMGLIIHSFVLAADPVDPWTLTLTFVLVFGVAFFEWICSLVVLVKRFNSTSIVISNTYGKAEKSKIPTDQNFRYEPPSHVTLQQQVSHEPLNNNGTPSSGKRWDLLMYFMSTLILLIGGGIQIILGKFFNCSNFIDPAAQGCPLPNSFNHNSVLHIFQIISVAVLFLAEIMSFRHRINLPEKVHLNA